MSSLLTDAEITQLKNNKDLITQELLDALRTTKEGKAQALEILDLPKDEEEYYLDAFGNRISFHGDRLLKKQYTKLKLSRIHLDELTRCFNDIRYFRDNYVRIRTPRNGVNFPDLRPYQNRIIEALQDDDEQYIILSPRQCVTGGTVVQTEFSEVTMRELFHACRDLKRIDDGIYQDSALTDIKIKCQSGYYKPVEVLRTVPLDVVVLTFGNGTSLRCSEQHVLITGDGTEVHAKDAIGKMIKTERGCTLCIDIDWLGVKEPMYDMVLVEDHLYYTNGVLSHNSGKSITIATWLSWLYCFSKGIVMGICANKLGMAIEFLKNTKDIVVQLPVWMTPGCKVWNVGSIAGDNGCRILTDCPSDGAFRGYSVNVVVIDECLADGTKIKLYDSATGCTQTMAIEDLYAMDRPSTLMVETNDGFKSFETVTKTEAGSGLEISFNGTSVRCTPDHKFWHQGYYIKAQDINVGDVVNGNAVTSIRTIPGGTFYDVFNVDGHHYTANDIEVSNCAYIDPNRFFAFSDAILPSQSSLTWKKAIFISTANGLNHFYQMVHGARLRKHFKDVTAEQLEDIKAQHKVLDIKRYGDLYDVEVDEPANGHRLIEVDWREVPRYKENGEVKTPEEFREEIIAKHGLVHFNQAYANCLDGGATVMIRQCSTEYQMTLQELYEFMANGDWQSQNLEILTASGWSSFQGIRKTRHKQVYAIVTQKRKFMASLGHRFYYNNKWHFASEVQQGDLLDGSRVHGVYRLDLRYPNYIDLFDILGTEDHTYLASGAINHNCFIGSSYTLFSSDTMTRLTAQDPIEQRSGILDIYEYPIKDHRYIVAVDPAKDGIDGFAVCVLDITAFPFKQVAACSTDIDYFLMPEHLADWGEMYNMALIVVENNEGAGQSVADMLKREYEYENLYSDRRGSTHKKYPGFRTTPRSRKLILDTMKMFAENNQLIINDAKTINELYTFILVNGKYQADEGCHDDRVMAMALAFAPFCEIKNFADAKEMIRSFYSKNSDFNFTEHLTIGYFDV